MSKVKADEKQAGGTHYKDMPVEPWELMHAVLTHDEFLGFIKGNMIKYALRAGRKPGITADEDINKYRHYKEKYDEVKNEAW